MSFQRSGRVAPWPALIVRMAPALFVAALLLSAGAPAVAAQEGNASGAKRPAASAFSFEAVSAAGGPAYEVDEVNAGLPDPGLLPGLATPQGTLEHFLLNARERRFSEAAHALNLNRFPDAVQAQRAEEIARKFNYVINKTLRLNWASIPDRPDGTPKFSPKGPEPQPRASVPLGDITAGSRSIPVSLQRFKLPSGEARWLISPFALAHIDAIWEENGPGVIERMLPREWRGDPGETAWWEWIGLLILISLSVVLGVVAVRVIDRLAGGFGDNFLGEAFSRAKTGGAVLLAVFFLYLASEAALRLSGPFTRGLDTFLISLLIIAATWTAIALLDVLTTRFRKKAIETLTDEEAAERRIATKVAVARQVIFAAAVIIGIGLILVQLEIFDNIGMSLVASAGAMSVVIGIAARPFLGDLIAGMQIAMTEPVRIGDTVYYDQHYGDVEEITFTYLVIHTWDRRRLIVPHSHFWSNTFENWSKRSPLLTRTVSIYADHKVDIGAVRQAYEEALESDDRWCGEDKLLEVTSMDEETVELRVRTCAENASDAWSLSVDMRETLIKFLQELDGGRYLVRQRVLVENGGERGSQDEARSADGSAGARDSSEKRRDGDGGEGSD